jgi:hypothetical protein
MDRDKMLDLPGNEIYKQSQIYEYLKEHTTKRPVVYHITVYQCEHKKEYGENLWIAKVDEFPTIHAYEDTLEKSLKVVGEDIEWMIKNQKSIIPCPVCNKGNLQPKRRFREQIYKGHKIMTPYSCFECDSCLNEVGEVDDNELGQVIPRKSWTDYGV